MVEVARYLEAPDTARSARLFLWHSLGLNQLFVGDGYTRDEDGRQGEREYLVPNRKTGEIRGLVSCDLELGP